MRSIAQNSDMAKRIATLQDALIPWLDGKTAPKLKSDGDHGSRPQGAFDRAGGS